jgi:hypothetical protein
MNAAKMSKSLFMPVIYPLKNGIPWLRPLASGININQVGFEWGIFFTFNCFKSIWKLN